MKSYIFSFLLCFTMIVAFGEAHAADPDLVVYLPLNEGKGDKVIDASENGHDGEIVGNSKWGDGKYGRAVELAAAGAEIQEHCAYVLPVCAEKFVMRNCRVSPP